MAVVTKRMGVDDSSARLLLGGGGDDAAAAEFPARTLVTLTADSGTLASFAVLLTYAIRIDAVKSPGDKPDTEAV